ncbi:hypothetical protein SCHPADRAFT_991751 [Schizopora paradoxa]|uniref:Uncharacterized protein n=1 Tax=Schizopora paradoxa TaxID=27342 RepID=A0A0H2SF44_9AGAM|nr:hypothetical protein SCHPADRAFT_991751 [Schizopora paradoxa]
MENINIHPQDLPAFLDPFLDFLAERLPPSLFDAVYVVLSYGLLLISAAFSFLASLPSWKPWDWDAQKILPPLISILAAYYAILSVYRTTGWMVRMTFRLMEWGVILGLIGAGVGWYMGTNGGQGGWFGGDRDGAPAYQRQQRTRGERPRVWEPFGAHEQWQYDEREARREEEGRGAFGVENFLRETFGGNLYDMAGAAAQFLQGVANNNARDGQDAQGAGGRRRQPYRRARDRTRR